MLEQLMAKANEFEMVTIEDSSILVNDFEGFDDNWEEQLIEIPKELAEILEQLEALGVEIYYESEDI